MSLSVDLNDETGMINKEHQELVENLVMKTIEIEKVSGAVEVSLTFVDKENIQAINREYRDINAPTDVISFALNEKGEDELDIIGDGMPNMLGDIVISVDHISAQAKDYGHSFERELGFLTVHGVLHLLGYDHMNEVEEKEMFSRQEDILTAYGLTR